MEFDALHQQYLAQYQPLFMKSALAEWDANISGSDEAFKRHEAAEKEMVELHSDRAFFAKLKALKEAGQVTGGQRRRLLDVMYRTFLGGQADKELQQKIVALETEVEKTFNTYRSQVDGKPLTENEILKILSDSKDSGQTRKAWLGYVEVGRKVQTKLQEVVRLRNEEARQLGFRNYYAMRLALDEIDEKQLIKLFDELDRLTAEPFAKLKKQIDQERAERFGIKPSELRPWHYGDLFFQEAPQSQEANLDEMFKDQDLLALEKAYYASIDMPVDDILARSDLYEKPGKCQHAFCHDIDRAGDIRILCNLKADAGWADTILHELGHAVYDKYIDPGLPFVLRDAAHSLTTEGVALMFGALAKNEDWLVKVRKLSPDKAAPLVAAARASLQREKLIFARWTQVVVRFELSMYDHPDQDLGKLWWDLKKRYQLLAPPEDSSLPGYAAKIHVVTVPAYYHNYMMGDLFSAQIRHHIATSILKGAEANRSSFFGRKEVGRYLRDRIFGPGELYPWNELTERATGEPLTAKYFVEQYVGG